MLCHHLYLRALICLFHLSLFLAANWMPVDPTMVHMAYKEEEEKAKVAIKKLDAILMDAGVMCFLELILHAYQ